MKTRKEQAVKRIEDFMNDADYSEKQIITLLTCEHEGYTRDEAEEAWGVFTDQVMNDVAHGAEGEQEECGLLDEIDWDSL